MTVPLFAPFRALGYITDAVPFAVQARGAESFVTVSVGDTWQVYNCSQLRLVLVGPRMPGPIQSLACRGDVTLAAVGPEVVECKRVHRTGAYCFREGGEVVQILLLSDHIFLLGKAGKLTSWRAGEYSAPQVVCVLGPGFTPTCLAHPATYVNKLAVGSAEGRLQLWNVARGTKLAELRLADCALRCLAPSPALDVVGVGLEDGRALLHNVRYDRPVAAFERASGAGVTDTALLGGRPRRIAGAGGACTALAFYTGSGPPMLAAGGGAGVVTVWDLEKRRLRTVLRDAHDAPLTALHFFPGEPRLLSAGRDNALKQWVLNSADGEARLLRFRSGHAAPPTAVRHYGESGLRILSAGADRALRCFSTAQDQQSAELSQGHVARRAKRLRVEQRDLKLPPITALDACQVRERDWCNVVSAHRGDGAAYAWRLQRLALGEHVLRPPEVPKHVKEGRAPVIEAEPPRADPPVTAVAVSPCGNFGVVGTAGGRLDRYNLQSGAHRGCYVRAGSDGTPPRHAHEGAAIVGLAVDACNRWLASVGAEGAIAVWDFRRRSLVREIPTGLEAVTHAAARRGAPLVAAADAVQRAIRLFDVEAGRLVRRFMPHEASGALQALLLSPDGRWLLAGHDDGALHVWDIPSARTLQVLRLGRVITALSLSPTGDMLATAHRGRRGVYLWANAQVYGTASVTPSEEPLAAALPALCADNEGRGQEESPEADGEQNEEGAGAAAEEQPGSAQAERAGPAEPAVPAPLAPRLATLSLLPASQWQSLLHLDAIRERNRPIQPPKKPEAAPFFLPTVPGVSGAPVFPQGDRGAPQGDPSGGGGAPLAVGGPGAERQEGGAAPHTGLDASVGWGVADGEEAAEEEAAEGEGTSGAAATPATAAGVAEQELQDEEGGAQKRKKKRRRKDAGLAGSRVRQRGAPGAGAAGAPLRGLLGAGDPDTLMAHLRALAPSALDAQLRELQLEEGLAAPGDVAVLAAWLRFLLTQLQAGTSFDFVQALLSLSLQLFGDALVREPTLAALAGKLRQQLRTSWTRLDDLLQSTRCVVAFLGRFQG